MDPLTLFFSAEGRLSKRTFWLSLLVLYALSFASLLLLSGAVTARTGLLAFATAQAALLWVWTVVLDRLGTKLEARDRCRHGL